MRLHATNHVILMTHSDCGGYGGLAAFRNDPRYEAEQMQRELVRAAEYVQSRIPDIRVSRFFVDFEGVWDASVESTVGAQV